MKRPRASGAWCVLLLACGLGWLSERARAQQIVAIVTLRWNTTAPGSSSDAAAASNSSTHNNGTAFDFLRAGASWSANVEPAINVWLGPHERAAGVRSFTDAGVALATPPQHCATGTLWTYVDGATGTCRTCTSCDGAYQLSACGGGADTVCVAACPSVSASAR